MTASAGISFAAGTEVALDLDLTSGTAEAPDGTTGLFDIADTDKSAPDFRGTGRLIYSGDHFLRTQAGALLQGEAQAVRGPGRIPHIVVKGGDLGAFPGFQVQDVKTLHQVLVGKPFSIRRRHAPEPEHFPIPCDGFFLPNPIGGHGDEFKFPAFVRQGIEVFPVVGEDRIPVPNPAFVCKIDKPATFDRGHKDPSPGRQYNVFPFRVRADIGEVLGRVFFPFFPELVQVGGQADLQLFIGSVRDVIEPEVRAPLVDDFPLG